MAPVRVTAATKLAGILAYSLCSSTMLVINKLAVNHLPLPSVVSGVQLLFSVAVVLALAASDPSVMEPVRWSKVRPFLVYTACFAGGILSSIKALEATSVGAVVAARSCLPIVVAGLEWGFMGRSAPNLRSMGALAGVLLSAVVYAQSDTTLSFRDGVGGLGWLAIWFALLAFQMTYGKFISDEVQMTQWERVFYTNALGLPWTVVLFFLTSEQTLLYKASATVPALTWLLCSCVVGVGISYTGWKLREIVSATTYTLVGVLNKMATIAFTVVLFPSDCSALGIAALVACIGFGFLYQDSSSGGGASGAAPKMPRSSSWV
mmetsp:Transcript_19791/g.64334  ORF Transcript_19791/g.64334 Transcript_19791/m.64334 type:complete len:320 (-) Transcript_19791:42-1001(-)